MPKKFFKNGFTLIEMLAFLFIFSLITMTFYSVWSAGTNYILFAKNQLAAVALANEKMEIVRNLAFDDIAHTTGSPVGNLKQNEDITRSGRTFHILTQIKNEDDPFDGECEATGDPDCSAPIDYKAVKITVSWDDGQHSIALSSRFVPAGIEQPMAGQGILVVNASSDKAGGALVSGSTVRVQNSVTGFDETHSTDGLGRLLLLGLPESLNKYQVTLTKSGYETVSTMPPYPDSAYNPVHEHASVVSGAVNTVDIFQNELADLKVVTQDYADQPVDNINFHLKGGKQVGTEAFDPLDITPNELIYNFDEDDDTGTGGEKDFNDISPGQYEFSLLESGYEIIGTDPAALFLLLPGEAKTLTIRVSPENVTALLVKTIRSDDGSIISGASVHLTNPLGYDVTLSGGTDGLVFFPDTADPPFESGTYDLSVSVDNYENYSGQVTVDAGSLKEEIILLTPSS
ncbi:MAG: hypothetical protein QG620_901 [Patescibacteria group bacterium]|nr:hypothetical protein [Patescibacteria group bacterium]